MSKSPLEYPKDFYSANELYRLFRESLEKRAIIAGAVEYDEQIEDDENEAYGWFTYTYSNDGIQGGDVFLYCDEFRIAMSFSLITFEHDLPTDKHHAKQLLNDYLDALQMALNGQLATVVTINSKTDQPQAVELILIDDKNAEWNIATVASYTYARGILSAATHRNTELYPRISLGKDHFLRPGVVNGRALVGRNIDIERPTPLSRKQYAAHDQSLTIQLVGGEPGESLWQLFYRRIEFWIVCIAVGIPAAWVMFLVPDTVWWSTPVLALAGLAATLLITFLTSFFLARRQQAVDGGTVPLAERMEEYINFRTVSLFFAGVFIVNLFASPIWTTKDHPELLITAAHYQPAMMPLIAASIGVFVAMGILLPTTRRNKVFRTIVMALSYSLVLYCNFVIFYAGDDSASAVTIPTLLVTVLPVGVIIWYIVDCFRPIKQ